jgi:hypothetical protein
MRAYLLPAGVAAALAVVTLAVAEIRTGHPGPYEWLSIVFLGIAVVAAPAAIGTRRSGKYSYRTKRTRSVSASASRPPEITNSRLSITASAVSILASLFTLMTPLIQASGQQSASSSDSSSPLTHKADPCAVPLGGPAHRATLSSSSYQGRIQISDVWYSLYSDDGNAGTAQLHSAMYGRLTGHPPRGYVIYSVGHWNRKSVSITTHVHGYPHFYPRGQIRVRRDGCWSVPSRNVGEPGSVGLSERILLMLTSPSVTRVFEHAEGKNDDGPGTGLTEARINSLNIPIISYFQLNTSNYDRVSG